MSDGDDALTISNGNPFMVPPTVPAAAASAAPANVLGAPGTTPPPSPVDKTLLAYAAHPTPVAGSGASASGFAGVGSHADVADLNPEFSKRAQAFQAAAKAAGIDTSIVSGFRDNGLQAKLYANYQAKQSGQALPYPEEGSGGIAAKPGLSYHNSGNAVDMYASDPKQQQWLIDNAPKFGLVSGASFGDPGHFQIAGQNASGSGVASSDHGQPMRLAGAVDSPSPETSVQASPASPASGFNPKGLYTMAMLSSMFPNHKFSPVEYDPFKVMPHQFGVGN